MRASKLATTDIAERELLLKEAMERFNVASFRLEEKYRLLLKETERLRAELKVKDEAMQRAEKLALLGQTAAAIAHEVRNPLGAIKLFLSVLRDEVQELPKALQLIEEIDRSANNLDCVVSNILQFAREERCDIAPLNLHAILCEQREMCLKLNRGEIGINLDLNANPYILGDEESLRRAFYNLMLNAVQALRRNGVINIRTSDISASEVKIEINDNGPGIAATLIERVFEPFVTGRKEGTGLGLAIVRQVVEQHLGKIKVFNRAGACFEIILPRNRNVVQIANATQLTEGEK